MELKWIEDFLTLANCNSMRQAAAARNISQSTLSRRLTSMEQRMGCTLVDRQHSPMKLTPAGLDFLEFAKRWHRELIQHRLQTRRGLTPRKREDIGLAFAGPVADPQNLGRH